jgi:hypothetical protein
MLQLVDAIGCFICSDMLSAGGGDSLSLILTIFVDLLLDYFAWPSDDRAKSLDFFNPVTTLIFILLFDGHLAAASAS